MATQNSRTQSEKLQYIRSMLGQLRAMAEAERYDMLSYLVEMAYIEATDIMSGDRPLRADRQKRDSAA